MGILIEGKPNKEERLYSLGEISLASGIKPATLQRRRRVLGIPTNLGGYTYAQVIQMVKSPVRRKKISSTNIDRLKSQLNRDGFL